MNVLWKFLLLVFFQTDIVINSQLACTSTEYYTVQETHPSSLTTYTAYRTRSKLVCCTGYSGTYPDCEKICENGYELRNGNCEPICNDGCTAGYCYKPHKCEVCDSGFEHSEDEYFGDCQPICSMECENGFCSSPDKCSCNYGYKLNDFNLCEAVCDEGCFNGKCLEPNECHCDSGFELINKDCHPICRVPCENGFCSSPYECVCLEGFKMNRDGECLPFCGEGCLSDFCSTPYHCATCKWGYILSKNNTGGWYCKPICDNCNFGDCILPGVCKCLQGYVMNDVGSCILPTTETTTLHQSVKRSTSMILEQSMPVIVKETSSDTTVIETKTDEFDSEYSTPKFFKDVLVFNNITTTSKPNEVMDNSEIVNIISTAKRSSTPAWVPWIIIRVATVLLFVAVAIGIYFLIKNKRKKARCNSQFSVIFDKENKSVDCVLCEN